MTLKLYIIEISPVVRAVLMTIEKLQLKVELIEVNLFKGEHLSDSFVKVNPTHTVPTLVDGDFVLWDSHAIETYLVTKYGKDDSLYPKDPQKRALIDVRLHFDSGVLFPAARGTVVNVLYGPETSFRQENLDKIVEAYSIAERLVIGPWMTGDTLTLADISCAGTLSSMNEVVNIDSGKFPKLAAWLNRVRKEDFFQKANLPGLAKMGQAIKSKLQQ